MHVIQIIAVMLALTYLKETFTVLLQPGFEFSAVYVFCTSLLSEMYRKHVYSATRGVSM